MPAWHASVALPTSYQQPEGVAAGHHRLLPPCRCPLPPAAALPTPAVPTAPRWTGLCPENGVCADGGLTVAVPSMLDRTLSRERTLEEEPELDEGKPTMRLFQRRVHPAHPPARSCREITWMSSSTSSSTSRAVASGPSARANGRATDSHMHLRTSCCRSWHRRRNLSASLPRTCTVIAPSARCSRPQGLCRAGAVLTAQCRLYLT
jgi:hypothetical protein